MCKETIYRTGDLLWDNKSQEVVESNGSNKYQDGVNVATGIPLTDDLIKELFNVIDVSGNSIEIAQGLIIGKEIIGYSFQNTNIRYLHELQHILSDNNVKRDIDKNKLRRKLSS